MSQIIEQLNDQGAFFNVEEQPVYTLTGKQIPGKKAVIDTKTGNAISVVSSGYKVISNEEVFQSFNDALQLSGIDLDGATARIGFSHGKARAMVTITIPTVQYEVVGDFTRLQIRALNSYDGGWKYSVRAAGMRLACLNGQVIPHTISHFAHQHRKNINIEQSAKHMVSMVDQFNDSQAWFIKMMNTPITDNTAQRWIARFVKGQYINDMEIVETVIAGKLGQELHSLWTMYRGEMGSNALALYNAFTHHITHKEYRSNRPNSMLRNEQRLETLLTPRGIFGQPETQTETA